MSVEELHGAYARSFPARDTKPDGLDTFLKVLLDALSKVRGDFKESQAQHVDTVQEFVAHKARMEAEITVLRAEVNTLKRQMELEKWRRDKEMESFGRASAVLGTLDNRSLYMPEYLETKPDAGFELASYAGETTIGESAEVKRETFSPQHCSHHPISREISVHPSTSEFIACDDDVASCATTENLQSQHDEDGSIGQSDAERSDQQLKKIEENPVVIEDSNSTQIQESNSTQIQHSLEPEKRGRHRSSSARTNAEPSDGAFVWAIYKMPNSQYDNKPFAARLKHLTNSRSAWRVAWLDGDRSVTRVAVGDVVRCMDRREVEWVQEQISIGNPFVSVQDCELHFRKRSAQRRSSRAAAAASSSSASTSAAFASFRVGDDVEGLYENGDWYRATIVAKIDGIFEVAWEDGDETNIHKTENELRLVVEREEGGAEMDEDGAEKAARRREGKALGEEKGAKRRRKGENEDVRMVDNERVEEAEKKQDESEEEEKKDESKEEESKEEDRAKDEQSAACVQAREEGQAASTEVEEGVQQQQQPEQEEHTEQDQQEAKEVKEPEAAPQPQPQEDKGAAQPVEEEMYSYDSDELSCGDPMS